MKAPKPEKQVAFHAQVNNTNNNNKDSVKNLNEAVVSQTTADNTTVNSHNIHSGLKDALMFAGITSHASAVANQSTA